MFTTGNLRSDEIYFITVTHYQHRNDIHFSQHTQYYVQMILIETRTRS